MPMCAILLAHPKLWRTSRLDCIAYEGREPANNGQICKHIPFNSLLASKIAEDGVQLRPLVIGNVLNFVTVTDEVTV